MFDKIVKIEILQYANLHTEIRFMPFRTTKCHVLSRNMPCFTIVNTIKGQRLSH